MLRKQSLHCGFMRRAMLPVRDRRSRRYQVMTPSVGREPAGRQRSKPDYRGVPSVAFTIPPIVAVGPIEVHARKQGLKFRIQVQRAPDWFTARQAAELLRCFCSARCDVRHALLDERLIGSIRRECLDHVVIFGERHLRHVLLSYMHYYNSARTHLSLNKDAPLPRAVQAVWRILPTPILGGLHHHYVRI